MWQTILFGKLVSIFSALMAAGIAVYLEVTKPATGESSVLLSTGWHWLANLPAYILGLYSENIVGALGIGSFWYCTL